MPTTAAGRVGNHFDYRLTTGTYHNGKAATKSVALSRHAAVLHADDRFTPRKALGGRWSNDHSTPLGRDELRVTNRLVAESAETVTFETSFLPTRRRVMRLAYPRMRAPVSGSSPNKFGLVSIEGGDRDCAKWEWEEFASCGPELPCSITRRDRLSLVGRP